MSTLPEDALRAAVLKALLDEVDAVIKSGKTDLKAQMDSLEIDSLSAVLPDGTKVAKVSRAGGATSAKVTDPEKFLAWVAENRPGEVVSSVRESYQKALLDAIDKAGAVVDPESGEVVPGVEFVTGTAYLTVTFSRGEPDGREQIKRAWRDGRVSLPSLLAIESGEPGA